MSVLRHSRFVVIPERLIELPKKALSDEGRNEDWEVGLAMEEKALTLGVDLWGPQFKDYAESAGKRMAEDWVRRVQDGGESLRRLEAALADLVIERDDLKAKNDALEARVAILERRIEAMRKTFKDGPDPD